MLGFDHSALDSMQDEWHEYLYPYKIGDYEYQLLSDPVELATINYNVSEADTGQILGMDTDIRFKKEGFCDAVAIWVDYDLTDDCVDDTCIKSLREHDRFVHYSKLSVKFFPRRVEVKAISSSAVAESAAGDGSSLKSFDKRIHAVTTFEHGNSDFNYNFEVV